MGIAVVSPDDCDSVDQCPADGTGVHRTPGRADHDHPRAELMSYFSHDIDSVNGKGGLR